MLRALYSLLLHLALPFVFVRLWLRARKEPGYGKDIAERFAFGTLRIAARNDELPRTLWVHAVSVGEVRAAIPLVGKLRGSRPDMPIVITVMTPTGRYTARQMFPDDIHVVYLPYDFAWAMRAFAAQIRPRVLMVMETEVWPNMLAVCESLQIPRVLVNARLSEKSLTSYQKNGFVKRLIADAFARFDLVLAQTEQDAKRLRKAGARKEATHITGNVKFDLQVNEELLSMGRAWRREAALIVNSIHEQTRRVILLASTREREEKVLVDAFKEVFADAFANQTAPLLVVVPRHPARFDDVCAILENGRFTVGRRSAGAAPHKRFDAWLGDSMGEMQAYYAMASVAIIGGSFEPLGGQNLIEAATVGVPTIIGPSTFNFAEATTLAAEAGALVQVSNPIEAFTEAKRLIEDDAARAEMRKHASAFASAHGGATNRTMDALAPFLR